MSEVTANELMLWWKSDIALKDAEAKSLINVSKEEIKVLKAKKGDINVSLEERCIINHKILKLDKIVKKAEATLEINKIRMADVERINQFLEEYQQNNQQNSP